MSTDSFTGKGSAIVALTKQGAALGRRLKALLPDSHLYLPDKFVANELDEHPFSLPARSLIQDIFGRYRHLVLIMAVGIAVRLIATRVTDKHKDPGVVVIDDSGKFVVSLLSGHIGGANELTMQTASLIGAQPVITTASESRGTISPDMLGRSFGWEIEDARALTRVSAALVNGEPVGVYQDAGETGWFPEDLSPDARIFASIDALRQSDCRAAVIITDRLLDDTAFPMPAVVYRPKSLVVGIGCNRGTSCADIEAAVTRVFSESGLSMRCIRNLATIDLKKNETGLLQFAAKYHLPVEYFDKESLGKVACPSRPSAMTVKHVGVPAVCEAAAILSSDSSLAVPKTSFNRTVTVAIARRAFRDTETRGKLFVIGTGPGDPAHMTLRARQTIARSEAVVGYKTYVDLIKPLLSRKEVIATGMGAEVERVNKAIDLASQGKTVALISGGDSGVYGMSGLVGEVLHRRGSRLAVEVIPGVPAMVAAGALLGAPLNGDVASVSLSDHLLPWGEITQRLRMAAQGNFVIALYNPKSKARKRQLEEAREIIMQYRSTSTPVGIVTNAYRPEQSVIITDLEHVLDHSIDMNTIVIIGNSTTFTFSDWMVTPRGYQTKYSLGQE
ncbi:MAG: precorrin-3B C(17)-methyltransferase [Dehalococcoidia bacterium]|nr:precorrin-3B C(17)-methyltransferase [Dehalococcoidia bacterium]